MVGTEAKSVFSPEGIDSCTWGGSILVGVGKFTYILLVVFVASDADVRVGGVTRRRKEQG